MVWVLKRKEMEGLGPKEEGDGWEEVWVPKRKEMDGRRSRS
jgi:hypothetical protein